MLTSYPVNYPEMVVKKSEGLTISEKKLVALGYRTFLRLWSYPNPYKMQKNGKELCDLLIVFDNHIIIFSDKECLYGDSGNQKVDWRRWYKRAIKKSAEQLIGAKAWIERYPDRIAIDAKCEKPFPLKIEITPETQFHLIAIAHGAANRCREYFGDGDGGLLIDNQIVGNMHIGEDCEPFEIGLVSENSRDFIHVFDDASYENVLYELDTIQDFLKYLEVRRELLLTKKVIAESENDILAQHLIGVMLRNASLFQETCKDYSAVHFEGGSLDELRRSSQYIDWRKTVAKSYFWDNLLQKTFFFIENGFSDFTSSPTLQEQSQLFYRLAREDRAHRLCLSESFMSLFEKTSPDTRATRIIYNPDEPETCYILLLFPRKEYMTDTDYHKVRRALLEDYCSITKADLPQARYIIGVARESADTDYSSEDFIFLDASEWTPEQQANAVSRKEEFERTGLLAERTFHSKTFFTKKIAVKGRDRNKPCPCGSGLKYKKCCGRN